MKLIDIHREFNTEEKALDYLVKMRWPNGVCCIECGSVKVSTITREAKSKNKNKRTRLYQCLEKECKKQFTATTGTIFHDSHLPLIKWFMAIAILCEAKKSVSACQMQRHLSDSESTMSYRTAWHLCHRIRKAMNEDNLVLDAPAVEADETYIGSRILRKRFARPKTKKDFVVLGMVERNGGRLKLLPIGDAKTRSMKPHLEKHISEQVGVIYTDEHPIYIFALKSKFPGKHQTLSHKHTYAMGDVHTNTIENAFSLFKKGLYGSFHHVSKKHLFRYCDEFSFRFNRRKSQELIFGDTTRNLLRGKNLPYATLTASQK
jgi:hypothetical protein